MHVVVVAYFGAEPLAACLGALGRDLPVTVVDNSSDAGVQTVSEAAGARYLDPGENRGFGAGVNVALRALPDGDRGDVLLLNPDALLTGDQARFLGRVLREPENMDVAAVAPTLIGMDGAVQRVLWPFPSPWRAWVEAIGLGRLNRARNFAVGAVLLLRREALDQVGLFDERFFLYAEETDWQRRANLLGWRAQQVDGMLVRHVGGGMSSDPHRRELFFHEGGETYVRKWFGSSGWAVYRAAMVVGATVRIVLLRGRHRSAAAERARIYWVGPRRAAGAGVR